MSTAPPRATENKLLAALISSETQNFLSHVERRSLAQGDVIYECDAPIDYVYFPETAVFSMLSTMEDGSTVEVGPVGDEGVAGLRVFLEAETSPDRVIVHVAGTAVRIKTDAFKAMLRDGTSVMRHLFLRYTQMLLAMTGKSGACYKLHSLEQQLARWLLMMHDYVGEDGLQLTHELIALTLGTRRAGITEAAINLRNKGLIDYRRGHIEILNRRELETKACECYGNIRHEYNLLYDDLAKHTN